MFFVDRAFLCERLRLKTTASYAIAPATEIGRIQSDRIIKVLNRSRKGGEQEVDYIPSDIMTANELEKEIGIPAHNLLLWTRRRVKVIPHYRISKQTTRFRRSSVLAWLERRTRG